MKKIVILILIIGSMSGCVFKRALKGGKGHSGGHNKSSIRR